MDAPKTAPAPFIRSRGLRVPKDPEITTGRIRGALRDGTYERKECDAVMRVVAPGARVLELGGGIGYVSTLIAVRKAPERVVTYEANPALIPYMRRLHAANDVHIVEPRNAILAPEPGERLPFHVRRNLLASSLDAAVDPGAIVETRWIERQPVASVLKALKPDVLVCDIEGAEATLLPAADWSGLQTAIIELHPQWIGAAGVRAVFDAMHRAGLAYYPKASEAKVVTFRRDW